MARAKSERWHARDFALLDPGYLRALGDGLELHADMPLVFLLFPLLSPLATGFRNGLRFSLIHGAKVMTPLLASMFASAVKIVSKPVVLLTEGRSHRPNGISSLYGPRTR